MKAAEWYTHPLYTTAPFYFHDVGVVILDEPIYLDEYGVLPEVDQLDVLKTKRGKQDTTFTAVGYGLQASFPDAVDWKVVAEKVRMVAYPKLSRLTHRASLEISRSCCRTIIRLVAPASVI